jgi:uncharacterized protein HemX
MIDWLLKTDMAIFVSILGLGIAIFQMQKQQQEQIQEEHRRTIRQEKNAAEQRTRIEQQVKFLAQRLDQIDNWISCFTFTRKDNDL